MNDDFLWPDQRPPASLYVHVPFCRHRCGYCNFALEAGRDWLIPRYVDALLREIDLAQARSDFVVAPLKTVYLGGGTPTRLAGKELQRLVQGIRSRFGTEPDAEITAEANPQDLDESLAGQLGELGFNRISLGVQSLNNDKLRLLERDHDAAGVRQAVEWCRSFARSISVDAIFATPGETLQLCQRDLSEILDLLPDHLSAYELTWEKGTRFWNRLQRGSLNAAEEDQRSEMYEYLQAECSQRGWQQYEVSSFARSREFRSAHNQVYWSGRSWLAYGPGAADFCQGVRVIRHRSTMHYMRSVESGVLDWEVDQLPFETRVAEIFCVGLRQLDGWQDETFREACGVSLHDVAPGEVGRMVQERLLERSPEGIRISPRGLMVHDLVCQRIMCAVQA